MNAIKHWMLPVLMLLCAAGLNTACDELLNDEKEDGRAGRQRRQPVDP